MPQPLRIQPLHNKVALVTGGAQRIGREIALELARAGADVAITYRTSVRAARQTEHALAALGVRALAIPCDVRRPATIRSAVSRVVKHFGGLDILVNNAALYESVVFERITAAHWDAVLATNLSGPYLVSQAALPALRARRGRIINLGSLGGLKPWTTHAHYCAAKAGLHHLSRIMAKALAPHIAVNCVAPGMIDVPSDRASSHPAAPKTSKDLRARLAARAPMQRNGTPAEVATAVLFFATAPHFITGQLLAVDGGLELA